MEVSEITVGDPSQGGSRIEILKAERDYFDRGQKLSRELSLSTRFGFDSRDEILSSLLIGARLINIDLENSRGTREMSPPLGERFDLPETKAYRQRLEHYDKYISEHVKANFSEREYRSSAMRLAIWDLFFRATILQEGGGMKLDMKRVPLDEWEQKWKSEIAGEETKLAA